MITYLTQQRKRKQQDEIISVLSDDDVVDLTSPEPKKSEPKRRRTTESPKKPAKSAEPSKKAVNGSPTKSKVAKKKVEETTKNSNSADQNADDVLATLPDAELPDVTESKPFSFAQKKDGPQSSGMSVDIDAKANCLSGLTIVFTGVLPNLDRDQAEGLAKQYGAKVTKAISGKTSLVVLGDEAGPSKVQKIKANKIKAITEESFLELLRRMPAEGGNSELALRAKEKRDEEERQLKEAVEREEREEREQAAKRAKTSSVKSESSQNTPSQPTTSSADLWTVKYAPKDTSQLCGNKGQINKLQSWLASWFDNAKSGFKNPGSDGSGVFRACLISGPPGIGKTSAAHLVAHNLGYDVLEKNASDVRSKSLLNSNLKSVLSNTSVVGFFKHQHDQVSVNDRRFCIIMDEVDGMSSGDHGGAGALSAFCRITSMPLILICNDKLLPKMRTFDRVTYDLPFRRPTENEVRSRLMTIALREKIKLDPTVIGQLVQATGNDIRQMITMLATVSRTQKTIGHSESKDMAKAWQKQAILKPFEITARLLSGQFHNPNANHTLNDKIDLYFNDIDFTPLMIQENYLSTRPTNVTSTKNHLERVASAADDISESDIINSLIRSGQQQWSLLPFHAVMSSVKPALSVAGQVTLRINFAGWLGQNSKAMKYQRLLQEIQYHTRLRTSTDKMQLRLDYLAALQHKLTNPLLKLGEEGIGEVIDVLDHYYLTKEDWDSIVDFGVGPMKAEVVLKDISTKVKTAFTRKYNLSTHPIAIYKTGNSVATGGRKQTVDYEDVIEDDTAKDEVEEEVENDQIDAKKDKLIKEVKPKKKRTKATGPAAKRKKT